MAIAATGLFKAPERLAYLVASCGTFQSVVGELNAAGAFGHIPWPWTDETDADHDWPRAIVSDITSWRTTQSGRKNWATEFSVYLSFQFEVPVAASATTELMERNWFMNQVGAIIAEMKVAEGTGTPYTGETHPSIASVDLVEGPCKEEESESEIPDPASSAILPRWWIVFEVACH